MRGGRKMLSRGRNARGKTEKNATHRDGVQGRRADDAWQDRKSG
jgi:hypothetical protein